MPSIPRFPLIGDPLRRITLPDDLDAVTSRGPEADPESVGLSGELIERTWDAAVDLYRSGVHPALQLCLRREGAVVLDRAIGHGRGNGPSDDRETPKVAATTETPFCIYSTSKAVTALVVHMLAERGALAIDDRVADHIPEYARHGKGEITIGHVLAHRAGVASLPREALDLDLLDDREHLLELICDAKPAAAPGRLLAYHAVSGRLHPRRDRPPGHGPRDPRGARGRDPRPARLPLGQLRGRRRRRRAGRALLHHRAAAVAAGLEPGHPGARGAGRRRDRDLERPALPHRRGPGGERGHDRERALALLRDLPPRR